jgi:Tfp pilus assembly protein PilW
LVELLVGATLSAMVMAAVLSSYIYMAKSLARLANQQTLETEARRTLATFTQDVQVATGISGTPSSTSVTLTIATATGSTTVAYTYDSTAGTLTRTPAGGTALILLRNITSGGITFSFYDGAGNAYGSYTNYLTGIKQLTLQISTQAGVAANGSQTRIYQISSSRLVLRNRAYLQ